MGAVIKAVAFSDQQSTDAVESAAEAGLACLDRAECHITDVDLLINIGGIPENDDGQVNTLEIRQRIGMNPASLLQDYCPSGSRLEGVSGFLNAVDIAAGALTNGQVTNVLIITTDRLSPNMGDNSQSKPVAGAVQLVLNPDPGKGFGRVHQFNAGESNLWGLTGNNKLSGYRDYHRSFIAESAHRCLSQERVRPGELDALITSQLHKGFSGLVAESVGVHADCRVPDLVGDWGDPHSTTPVLCIYHLWWDEFLQSGKTLLFASMITGAASACALYRE